MRKGIEELLRRAPVLLDGGMGSALIARGLVDGGCPERWNLDWPEDVSQVHASHLAAGCDVILTNTFGASAPGLARHGDAGDMEAVNLAGARIAREAAEVAARVRGAGSGVLVAGDIGPSGLLLPPVGDADPVALEEAFAAQAAALARGGVDYLAVETMSDLEEALCALRGARSSTDLPVTVCLTFERRRVGFFTIKGNRLEDAVRTLADEGAAAVGANCSIGSDAMLEASSRLVAATEVPVLVKPNAGMPRMVNGRPVYGQPPEEFARDMAAAARRGVAAVGGCCGADQRFIAALASALAADASER